LSEVVDVMSCKEEIERAVRNAKRAELDRWMRREWYKAAARGRWSAERKAEWKEWRRRRREDETQEGSNRPDHHRVGHAKVWVKGHVPKDFLDWVERHWSHDRETRSMLGQCCFEAWER
jgi:hypothetical protein